MSSYKKIHAQCLKIKDGKKALEAKRYFKTGKGEYGAGDVFLGISVPDSRVIIREFSELPIVEIKKLLKSKYHEERFIGLMILKERYLKAVKKNDRKVQDSFFKIYYSNRKYVNNWDLVDSTAPYLSGHYFFENDDQLLVKLINSKSLWDRRIAILSLAYFIQKREFSTAVKFIKKRLWDEEDLMHKACGWMLREIGKRDERVLRSFLDRHASKMPRTALRYSIEKFPIKMRRHYLEVKI